MDRDIALSMVQKLTVIQTATQHIAAGVAENQSNRGAITLIRELNDSTEEPEEPEVIPEEQEEPQTKTTTRKK